MPAELGVVKVPFRFEPLSKLVGRDRLGQVLLECPSDLEKMKRLVAEVQSAGQGKLQFLIGDSGLGKTCLVESLAVFLSDVVGLVLTPPPDYELPLRDLPAWLATHIPEAQKKAGARLVVVNLDGRELPSVNPDETRAAMVNLNAFLRRNAGILATWPVVNEEFAQEAIQHLQRSGGGTALSSSPTMPVNGLESSKYYDALLLILRTTSVTLDDAAVSDEEVRGLVKDSTSIGNYLERVHQLVVSRYDVGAIGQALPKVYIVVTSNADTNTKCRMLRRGDQFLVDPDRLLQFSRANVADDWRSRAKENPRRGLPFIMSLFEVRLVNISSSAVVNACAFCEDSRLQQAVRRHYPNPIRANAANALRGSSLVRALKGEADASAGYNVQPTDKIANAYDSIQALTRTRHRAINQAVVQVLAKELGLNLPNVKYESNPLADRDLRPDVMFQRQERPETLEFTHRSIDDASVAAISSYVLAKIQDYARDYNLI